MVCFQGARGSGTRRWQIHRCLAVSVPLLRAWVHFPRAPEQFVASPLCLVGYVRWDARSDRVPPLQTIIFSSFTGRTKGCRPCVLKFAITAPACRESRNRDRSTYLKRMSDRLFCTTAGKE